MEEPDPARWRQEGLIAAAVYHGGVRLGDILLEDAGQWARSEGHVVWIGLYEPSAPLLELIRAIRLAPLDHRGCAVVTSSAAA